MGVSEEERREIKEASLGSRLTDAHCYTLPSTDATSREAMKRELMSWSSQHESRTRAGADIVGDEVWDEEEDESHSAAPSQSPQHFSSPFSFSPPDYTDPALAVPQHSVMKRRSSTGLAVHFDPDALLDASPGGRHGADDIGAA
eukprot:Hpha_TRINITY_DN14322_c0_g1::TRINITY_DN14322_c0_g1_i1::g.86546::m.86546